MAKKRTTKKTAKKKAKAAQPARKKSVKKSAKPKKPRKTKHAYAKRTKAEIKANGKPLHSNGFNITDQQRRFIDEYMASPDMNATQAAIRAGYSKKSAGSMSAQLLANPKIKHHLREKMKEREKRVEVTADRVIRELAVIGFANLGEFASWRGHHLAITDIDEIPKDIMGAISSIEPVVNKNGVQGLKIKLGDKIQALKLLGQHLNIYERKPSMGSKGQIVEFMEDLHKQAEELDAAPA